MNVREWALPVYTILMQLSVGTFLLLWIVRAVHMARFGPASINRIIKVPLTIIFLTMAMYALGRNFFRLIFAPPVNFNEHNIEKISVMASLSQFILLGAVIYLGFNPPEQMVYLINDAIKNLPH